MSSFGLQVFDGDGNVLVDTDHYLPKREGEIVVGNNFDGYIPFPGISPSTHVLHGDVGFSANTSYNSSVAYVLMIFQIQEGQVRIKTGPDGAQKIEVWRV